MASEQLTHPRVETTAAPGLEPPSPESSAALRRAGRVRFALFVLVTWLAASAVLALVLAVQERLPFAYAFWSGALQCTVVGLVATPIWWALPRLRKLATFQRLAVHLLLAVAGIWLIETLFHLALALFAGAEIADLRREASGYWAWLQNTLLYVTAVAALVTVYTTQRLRRQQQRTAQLELLRREAELRALRAQLRPHFLFNTLNSIYALVHERPNEAALMVSSLSDLLRETMELTDQDLVPLAQEVQLVRRYLDIEAIRLGDRLRVEVDVPEDCARAQVPPLILQPLVENAILHGISPRLEEGTVRVTARRRTDVRPQQLELSVIDDGVGCPRLDGSEAGQEGNGLRITRSRLINHYPEHDLHIGPAEPTGCEIRIRIPYRACQP